MGSRHIEIIARGLAISDGHVLLCESVSGAFLYLPGGHVEFGEPAATALAREFREESGIDVQVEALLAVQEGCFVSGGRHHEINLVFHVEHPRIATERWPSLEPSVRFRWVPFHALAAADLRPSPLRDWLQLRLGGGEPGAGVRWMSAMDRDVSQGDD